MAIKTLEEKFQHELGDIYDAEHQFLEAQQQMVTQAVNPQVKRLLEQHITQTEQQIKNLEQVFAALGAEAKRVKCQASAGIVAENKQMLKNVAGNPALVDLAIAGGSAKVEHYEVSCYRALVAGAEAMGQTKAAQLLQKNLAQEEQTAGKVEGSMPKLLQQAMSSSAATTTGAASSGGGTKSVASSTKSVGTKSVGTKSVASKKGATSAKDASKAMGVTS